MCVGTSALTHVVEDEASDEEIDDEVLTSPELPPNKFTPAPLATTGSPSDPTAATGTTGAPDTPTGESATDMPLITEIAQGKDVSFVRVPTAQPMQLRADLPTPQGIPKAIVPMCGIWNDLVDVDVDASQSQAVSLMIATPPIPNLSRWAPSYQASHMFTQWVSTHSRRQCIAK